MKNQRGNILFLILLAVILFAALSYAVTSSMRGGGNSATKESLQSQVAAMQNAGIQIRSGLQRLMLVGGYSPWQVDYSSPSQASYSYTNANCTSAACRLHAPTGGAVASEPIPAKFLSTAPACAFSGRYGFRNITVKDIGADDQRDLLIYYPGISTQLCLAINDANGVNNVSATTPPTDSTNASFIEYSHNMSAEIALTDTVRLGDAVTSVASKQMFCVIETQNGCNYAYFVLIER